MKKIISFVLVLFLGFGSGESVFASQNNKLKNEPIAFTQLVYPQN